MAQTRTRNRQHLVVTYMALAVGMALSVTLLASLGGRASEPATPAASPKGEETGIDYDSMIADTDEGRAQFGQIFIGRVIAVAGTEELPTSDPEDVIPIILYDVEVEQTLKGEAKGVVRVWYEGFDSHSADDVGDPRKLREGERLLFFAGFNPDKDRYPVNAGIGVIPIGNEGEAGDLVATFAPLIRQAERNPHQPPPPDPCEQPGEPASIALDPERGAVGDVVRLTGGPFLRAEVAIWWDDRDMLLGAAEVGTDCTIDAEVTIPKTEPGKHRIVVEDARGRRGEAKIEVDTE
jgi:hypothetical protein